MIQFAHKRADKNFNDIVAQLYQQEFKTQEKAKHEHIRQAKEKALEEQRVSEENQRRVEAEKRAEADRIAREHDKATEQPESERTKEVSGEDENERVVPNEATNGIIGPNWSSVSPEQASEYLSKRTGISADWWLKIAMAESSGNPMALNSIGCFGLYQINQSVHGNFQRATPEQYLNKVIEIYNSQGKMAWEVVSMNGW